jgi:NAD(P)H dehydrogenase (quinone)
VILVTGATGHLGRHVITQLLKKVRSADVVAGVRSPEKAKDLAGLGVQVRALDYDRPETVAAALDGVEKVLLISSSEVGKRAPQHKVVIEAAKKAGVKHLVYTSLLRADSAKMGLAGEHLATEQALRASGLAFTLLRNGWYSENYTGSLGAALEHGVMLGAAG